MKNNQFKKLIRTHIEAHAATKNLQCVYVDLSNNERIFYIYDSCFTTYGTIRLFLNSDSISIKTYLGETKVAGLGACHSSISVSYLQFGKALALVRDFFFRPMRVI